ncbi:MAG: pyrophosphohydrolase domain-containing protein [Candidatus Kariarchaeaceae archaeon]|jgi:NTP pyrophosphatase (non-canonical NTP hydrolase)
MNWLIDWFAERMAWKLQLNSHKRDSYKDMNISWLRDKLSEEIKELDEAVLTTNNKAHEIIDECADVANVVMFIADKYRRRDGIS